MLQILLWPKWKVAMQNGRLKFKMQQISFATSCKYHAIWKGLSSKCRRCHAKWEVLSPQCTLLFVSLLFWPWWFRQFSFFLALLIFTGFLTSWLCLCWRVHRNQSHNCKEITNRACTQTKTTNKATTIKATTTKKLLLYYTYIITTVATQTKTTATTTATITRITKQTRTHN